MTNLNQPRQQQLKQLNYRQLGEGKHIVLIHGLFGNLENLNMVAKNLSQHYCVTSIDVRNHGDSFHQKNMDYQVMAEDVINLLDKLAIEHCDVLGHSMGGKIAMKIALSFPQRVNKLIIADIAPVKYPAHHLTIIEGLQAIDFSQVHKRKDADAQLAKYVSEISIRQFLLRNISLNEQGEFQFKCNLHYIEQGYQQIMQSITGQTEQQFSGDTLFIKGANSDYILPEHKSAISLLFPRAKAKIIQGAGHWLHAEKPVAFNKIVEKFLSN